MEAYTDALFEERRGRLEIREPTDLVCGSQNKITKMCVKPSCPRRSLFCNKRNCYSCRKYDHQKCPQVCLKDITQDLNSHIPARQYMIEQVGEIEKKFCNSLRVMSNHLGDDIRLAGLDEKSKGVADDIYLRKNAKCLKGKDAF